VCVCVATELLLLQEKKGFVVRFERFYNYGVIIPTRKSVIVFMVCLRSFITMELLLLIREVF
jgi:hypothetical protein